MRHFSGPWSSLCAAALLLTGCTAEEAADAAPDALPPVAEGFRFAEPGGPNCTFSEEEGGYVFGITASAREGGTRLPVKAWVQRDSLDDVLPGSTSYEQLDFVVPDRPVTETVVLPATAEDVAAGYDDCRLEVPVEFGE